MPTNDTFYDCDSITCLASHSGGMCTKIFKLNEAGAVEVVAAPNTFMWMATALRNTNIQELYNILSTIGQVRTRCIVRGALATDLDPSGPVTRVTRGTHPTFVDTPRRWVSIDIDKFPGNLAQFYTAFHAAYPMFNGVSHIVQRTSSFGMNPGLLNVRLWYRCSLPVAGNYWTSLFEPQLETLHIDESMYRPGQLQFTAAPVFQNVDDPCAERWTLVEGLFEEVDTDSVPVEIRTAPLRRAEGPLLPPPTVGNPEEIQRAIDIINMQTARFSTGHHHAFAAGSQLYGLGCPPEKAIPVMQALIPRAHGRTPRPGECESMWEEYCTRGVVYLNTPSLAQLFNDAPDAPANLEQTNAVEETLVTNNIGEWVQDAHINADRYERMFLKGVLHWTGVDYELKPEGYWKSLDSETTLELRVSRDSRMPRPRASATAFAIRARNLREDLDPPCHLQTRERLSNIIMLKNGYMKRDEVLRGERTLYPHDPNHFALSVLNVGYNPNAECPRFKQWLNEVFPSDEASQTLLLRTMAYLLTPDISLQKFFIWVGPGGCGKSTLTQLVTSLLGTGNVASVSNMGSLLETFGLAPLLGKTLAFLPEANQGSARTASGQAVANVLKYISGGDSVQINRKNLPQITTRLPTRLIALCNTPPELGDESGALERRLVVLRFNVVFSGVNRDPQMEDKLIAEKEGILRMLLDAMPGLYGSAADCGLFTPDSARPDQDEVLRDAAPVASFLLDCVMANVNATITNADIHLVCNAWCIENSVRPLNGLTVLRQMNRRYNARRARTTGGTRAYEGVGFTAEGLRILNAARAGRF